MIGYTKLFATILDSTIWQEAAATRLVWITMLVMQNRDQVVEASVPGLAKRAGVEIEECEAALATLRDRDPYSRSQEHEGRRIEDVDGGWLILNGAKYRSKLSVEDRREYQRNKQAEYRKRKATLVDDARKAGAKQAIRDGTKERMEEEAPEIE